MLSRKLQLAAETGNWEGINPSSVTKKMLSQRGEQGETIFHIAAECEKLHKIPKELMTDDIWLQENKVGETVIHLAAAKNEFHLVPKHLMTENTLLTINYFGWTVMDVLCVSTHINTLPKELLSDRTLGRTDGEDGSCLQIVIYRILKDANISRILKNVNITDVEDYKKMLERNLKTILSYLSTKKLNEHLTLMAKTPEGEKFIKNEIQKRAILKKLQGLENSIEL